MQLYPAIDIRGGRCVRLKQGLFNDQKVYFEDPVDAAKNWESQGGTFLHLVDLDGAVEGRSVNLPVIRRIVESVGIPAEIGGGIRTKENVRDMLDAGITRVIIGTRAVQDPDFVAECVKEFGEDRIVVGIDAKDGMVATHGWETTSTVTAADLAVRMRDLGVRHIIYTDISKDGMLSGPNVEATARLTELTGIDVIASGGVSCEEDLARVRAAGISGCIIGKALYEGRVDLKEAVRKYEYADWAVKESPIAWSDMKMPADGLVPVIVQEEATGEVLMLAYMNEEAFRLTLETGVMTYWSRSRQEIWVKGLTSGHFQYVRSIRLDCDKDTLLAQVHQIGAACHTGSHNCFFRTIEDRNEAVKAVKIHR